MYVCMYVWLHGTLTGGGGMELHSRAMDQGTLIYKNPMAWCITGNIDGYDLVRE